MGRLHWIIQVGLIYSPESLKAGNRSQLQKARDGRRGRTQPVSLALQMEEDATGQGMRVMFRNWKRQGHKFPSRASRKEYRFAHTMILAQ